MRVSFVTDSTLGKLAKHLRLAGFDTLVDTGVPNAQRLSRLAGGKRFILTRSTRVKKALGGERVLFIREDRLPAQMKHVLVALKVKQEELRPLIRCALCNRLLDALPKEDARGRVPDFIWQQHDRFRQCPACHRIYWHGSHADRWKREMAIWSAP